MNRWSTNEISLDILVSAIVEEPRSRSLSPSHAQGGRGHLNAWAGLAKQPFSNDFEITMNNPKQIAIRCPKTGQAVPTGVATDEESFKTMTLTDNSFQCPRCGEMHTWSKKDAFLV